MNQNTHLSIDRELVGEPVEITEGRAVVRLLATPRMAADERGLVHGGFTFALADYAVMLAVNDPFVVLGGSEVKFLKPVSVGQTLLAEARVTLSEGKKRVAEVAVTVDGAIVMEGTMTAFVMPKHVLG